MKELFLHPCTADERARFEAEPRIRIDPPAIWRDSLYVLLYDPDTGRADRFARVEGLHSPDGDAREGPMPGAPSDPASAATGGSPAGAPSILVQLAPPVDLPGAVSLDPGHPPTVTTFERLFRALADRSPLAGLPPIGRKESDLLVKSYVEQGVAQSVAGKLYAARDLFDHALELDPDNHLIFFYLANIALDTGRIDLALYYYGQVLARNPAFGPACDYMGMAWLQKNDPERALAMWLRSLELNPKSEFARVNRAKLLIQQKKFDAARDDLESALQLNAENVFVLNLLGVVNANLDRLDEAVANWRKVIELGKDDEYLHLNLARALTEKGDYDDALYEYRRLLDSFPDEHEMHQAIEKTIKKVQETKAAAESKRKSRGDEVPGARARRMAEIEEQFNLKLELRGAAGAAIDLDLLAGFLAEFGFPSKGIARLVIDPAGGEDALGGEDFEFDPSDRVLTLGAKAAKGVRSIKALLRRAAQSIPDLEDQEEIRLRTVSLGDDEPSDPKGVEEAIEKARRMLADEPENEWAHYSLGSLEAQRGNFGDAVIHFGHASELNANNAVALYALGLAHVRLEQFESASVAFQRAVIAQPDEKLHAVYEEWNFKDSLIYFGLGDVFIRMGKFREAIEAFKKGLSIDAASSLAHFQLGTCYEVLGDYPNSIESLTNALSLNNNFAFAFSKLGIVYFKTGRLDEAFAMLQKAVAFEGADSETLFYLGEVADRLGKTQEARAAWNSTIEVAPSDDIYHRKAQDRLTGRPKRPEGKPEKELKPEKEPKADKAPKATREPRPPKDPEKRK